MEIKAYAIALPHHISKFSGIVVPQYLFSRSIGGGEAGGQAPWAPETEEERPRMTIAARRWLTVLDAIPEQAWGVEEFVLLRSRLLAGGAGYETLGRYPLAG